MELIPIGVLSDSVVDISTLLPMTVERNHQFGNEYCIGHMFDVATGGTIYKYKLIEVIGCEVHEHLIVSHVQLCDGWKIARNIGLCDFALLGTKIYGDHAPRFSIPTTGIMMGIAMLRGKFSSGFVPMQLEALSALHDTLRSYFVDWEAIRLQLTQFEHAHHEALRLDVPTYLNGLALLSNNTQIYDTCVANSASPSRLNDIFTNVFLHDELVQDYGFAYDYKFGNLPPTDSFSNYADAICRTTRFPTVPVGFSKVYYNPHISGATSASARHALLILLDIFDHARLTDIDMTIQLCSTVTGSPAEITMACSEVTGNIDSLAHGGVDWATTLRNMNIHVDDLFEALADLEDGMTCGYISKFRLTKHFDETLQIGLNTCEDSGLDRWIGLHLDGTWSRIATPMLQETKFPKLLG